MKKIILVLIVAPALVYSQWTQSLNGITIWSLTSSGNNIYAGSTGSNSRIFHSPNGGFSWDTVNSANGQTVFAIALDSTGKMFVANNTTGLLRSTNGGQNFTIIPTSMFGNSGVQSVVCGKKGYVYVATNGTGIYRSIDTGNTFTQTGLNTAQVVTLLVDKFNPAIIYAGATQTYGGFYRSTDFGATFSSNLNPGLNIFGIVETDALNLFTVTSSASGVVSRSTDGGLNWTGGATGYVARGIAALGSTLYIAGNGGVFISFNYGTTFSNFGITASSTPVITTGFEILAGVSGSSGGVWYTFLEGITGNTNEALKFSLLQNYPNPFNPSTKINFSVPKNSFVKLIVYNVLGKEILTLVNRQMEKDNYSVDFYAADYPSGIYFYKLVADGNTIDSKKMVLIK